MEETHFRSLLQGRAPAAAVPRLERYAQLVEKWSACHNLVHFQTRRELVERHIVEALALHEIMGDRGRLLDVGSGAGLPGVPLLCARPEWTGVLLEPRHKRWAFLKTVVRELGLDAEVVAERFEGFGGVGFDLVTARAVGEHEALLAWARSHLNDGGFVVIWGTEEEERRLRTVSGWHVLSSPLIGLDQWPAHPIPGVFHVKPRIIAVANQKGGVGKTTTVVNLGASLAAYEQRTLLVDMDPQSNCTSGVGHVAADTPGATSYTVITGDDDANQAIRGTLSHLGLIPATPDLAGAEVELVGLVGREFRARDALRGIEGYRFLLIDCPPSLGQLTVNALAAADALIVPVQCEYFALEGVSELMKTVDEVRRFLNPGLALDGILLTMFDERTNLSRQVADEVRDYFGDVVFETVIPRNVRLAEAPSFGRPIHSYDLRSRGAQAYLSLGREYLKRLEANHG